MKYQKSYLKDLWSKLFRLITEEKIVMTDLKPENTLYNPDIGKVSIIDLGGTVRVKNKPELYKFNMESAHN